jgi:hypothetical protein
MKTSFPAFTKVSFLKAWKPFPMNTAKAATEHFPKVKKIQWKMEYKYFCCCYWRIK